MTTPTIIRTLLLYSTLAARCTTTILLTNTAATCFSPVFPSTLSSSSEMWDGVGQYRKLNSLVITTTTWKYLQTYLRLAKVPKFLHLHIIFYLPPLNSSYLLITSPHSYIVVLSSLLQISIRVQSLPPPQIITHII